MNSTRRRAEVARMTKEGATLKAMAAELGVSTATIAADKNALGLSREYKTGRKGTDPLLARKRERAREKVKKLSDRRRFPVASPASGRGLEADQEVQDEGRTMFPSRVFTPEGPSVEPVLKDGCNNSKIGGDVLVGHLKGAYIATLTLEERATCPRSCLHWADCYGNTMQHARRFAAGPELEASLRIEVAEACEANDKVLIRLHVLGDFYSRDYVVFWAELLDTHPNLYVFGFTAHKRDDGGIGRAIAVLRKTYPNRFMIRHSGATGAWGAFTIPMRPDPDIEGGWPKEIGDAIVCPATRDPYLKTPQGKHCGNCSACWSCNRPIIFPVHGEKIA